MSRKYIRNLNLICTLVILTLSCGDVAYEAGLAPNKTYTIGHAGMGFSSVINPFNPLPDNSFAAIRKALLLGADGVEVDVQMSKDSVLILYHDNFLDSKTKMGGCVIDKNSKDLLGKPYVSDFPFSLMHDEGIISLDSLFKYALSLDSFPQIHLDIHAYNYCNPEDGYGHWPVLMRSLIRTIEQWKVPVERIFPTSSYLPLLHGLKSSELNWKLFFEEDSDYEKGLKTVIDEQLDGMVIKSKLIPGIEGREKARKHGIELAYFGGKSKSSIREMLRTYPEYILVNNVRAMKKVLNEE